MGEDDHGRDSGSAADKGRWLKINWSWTGAVIFVLALGLAVGFVAATIITLTHPSLAENTITLSGLASFGNSLLVLVAGYLGLRVGLGRRRDRDDDE